MRPLEIIILLLNLVALLMVYIPLHPPFRWAKFLPAGIVVITLVHLIVEGYRWQMVPAYILTAALFLLTLPSLLKNTNPAPARGALRSSPAGLDFYGC